MKTKRIVSVALSAVMALSLAVPAFAAANTNRQTVISGKYQEAVIDVTVPQTANAFIDPYGLGTSATKSDTTTKVQITGQVVTAPLAIRNNTDMDLDIGATVTGVVPETSTMKLAATTTQGSGTEGSEDYVAPATAKSAYVVFQAAAGKTAVADGTDNDLINDAIIDDCAAAATWTSAAAKQIVVGTKAASGEAIATMKAATLAADDGSVTAYPAGSMVMFRLTGDCVKAPKAAWEAADTFTVTVAFTFAPHTAG